MRLVVAYCIGTLIACASVAGEAHPHAAPGITSLTNREVQYRDAPTHAVTLKRGPITAIVVDNSAVDRPDLPGHRAGYNGVASLIHRKWRANLFVPGFAGLNFEHIHDGSTAGLEESFEPRKFPMHLRIIDEHTVELYQPPTGNWKLESCSRIRLLEDGTIEYTFECIPRAGGFRNGFIGLFWASYIHQPADTAIYFRGRLAGSQRSPRWIKAVSPRHGEASTHPPAGLEDRFHFDDDFPITLANHPSRYVYTEPWYYGVSHGMAYVQMFRARDRIWLVQSPSGGGHANPAWDFQWFIPDYQVGRAYGFVMRAALFPYESPEQVELSTRANRRALEAMR